MKPIAITLSLVCFYLSSFSQKLDEYQVFTLKYMDSGKAAANAVAMGGKESDTIHSYFMFWLMKGQDNRNILVDAGFIDTTRVKNPNYKDYVRPDILLQQMNLTSDDISDLIITHPHWDHIGGITLFPKAKLWMNKADYHYFVGEAWQEGGKPRGFNKQDVRNIIEANLQGRLTLVDGDDVEIMPGIRAYIHSKHSFENMSLVVNTHSEKNKILLASDAIWFYYNLDHLLSNTLVIDSEAFVKNLQRLKTLVPDPDLIIPGHDAIVFSKFPKITDRIIKISK